MNYHVLSLLLLSILFLSSCAVIGNGSSSGVSSLSFSSPTSAGLSSCAGSSVGSSSSFSGIGIYGAIRGNEAGYPLGVGVILPSREVLCSMISTNRDISYFLEIGSNTNTSLSIVLYVDENKNGKWDFVNSDRYSIEGYTFIGSASLISNTNINLDLVIKRVIGNVAGMGASAYNRISLSSSYGLFSFPISGGIIDVKFPLISNANASNEIIAGFYNDSNNNNRQDALENGTSMVSGFSIGNGWDSNTTTYNCSITPITYHTLLQAGDEDDLFKPVWINWVDGYSEANVKTFPASWSEYKNSNPAITFTSYNYGIIMDVNKNGVFDTNADGFYKFNFQAVSNQIEVTNIFWPKRCILHITNVIRNPGPLVNPKIIFSFWSGFRTVNPFGVVTLTNYFNMKDGDSLLLRQLFVFDDINNNNVIDNEEHIISTNNGAIEGNNVYNSWIFVPETNIVVGLTN